MRFTDEISNCSNFLTIPKAQLSAGRAAEALNRVEISCEKSLCDMLAVEATDKRAISSVISLVPSFVANNEFRPVSSWPGATAAGRPDVGSGRGSSGARAGGGADYHRSCDRSRDKSPGSIPAERGQGRRAPARSPCARDRSRSPRAQWRSRSRSRSPRSRYRDGSSISASPSPVLRRSRSRERFSVPMVRIPALPPALAPTAPALMCGSPPRRCDGVRAIRPHGAHTLAQAPAAAAEVNHRRTASFGAAGAGDCLALQMDAPRAWTPETTLPSPTGEGGEGATPRFM